jgi:large subunit ribosomal protein L5
MHHLQEIYKKDIVPKFMKDSGIKNPMAVPRLAKIVINCGMGEALSDKKALEKMSAQLAVITGQKPQVMRSKRAISTFKLRAGVAIGLRVTLRGNRMLDFLMKFIMITLPRVRDFRGIPTGCFDGSGNYTLGIKEHTIFSELEYSMIDKVRGLEISFVTTAGNDKNGKLLLSMLGMPFSGEKEIQTAGRK